MAEVVVRAQPRFPFSPDVGVEGNQPTDRLKLTTSSKPSVQNFIRGGAIEVPCVEGVT